MDWLERRTGKGNGYWFGRIQALIIKHSKPSNDPKHDVTDTFSVLKDLSEEVIKTAPVGGEPYDENMYAFSVLAQICALWYGRVHLAKISDPARPVGNAMRRYNEVYLPWQMGMFQVLVDISKDTTYFPGQRWQHPFSGDAESGDFI